MKTLLAGVAILLGGLVGCSYQGERIEPISQQEVDQVMGSYYQQPDRERLARALAYFDESDTLQTHPTALAPLEGFLAGLAVKNGPEWKMISQEIVWEKNMRPVMANMPKRVALLRRMLANNDTAVTDAAALDFLWGAFSATGDAQFVTIIIRTKNRPSIDPVVRAAAAWSLSAQRKVHPAVETALQQAPAAPDKFMQQMETQF